VLAAADESVRLEFLLIAHCARLEFDLVAMTARQVLMAANTMSPQTSLRLRFNASLALSMCGRNSEAVEAATMVHFDAEAGGARHLLVRTAAFLADEAFDAGDDLAAAAWTTVSPNYWMTPLTHTPTSGRSSFSSFIC
jgi:hypothetical protein